VSPSPSQSLKTATDSIGSKAGQFIHQTQHLWHHSIDKKHSFLHVEFEVIFIVFLRENLRLTKRDTFSWAIVHPFFKGGV
jgi:hypothetical protein